MKKILEKICDKIAEKPEITLLIIFLLYLLLFILFVSIFETTETFFSIFVNPFFLFGIPYLILDYLRYKELKKTYKNYTQEQFIEVYKKSTRICV